LTKWIEIFVDRRRTISRFARHNEADYQLLKYSCGIDLNLCIHFVSAAVRRLYAQENEKDFRKTIVIWLDGAKDRDGGRKRRERGLGDGCDVDRAPVS